jgi:quinol monooxygenase YgiN
MLPIDLAGHPDLRVKLDNFSVPAAARAEFLAATARNFAFIRTQPGFLGHLVFEKLSGPSAFTIATIAAWESEDAIARAKTAVGAYYRQIGFDPAAFMAQHGIRGEIGDYTVHPD